MESKLDALLASLAARETQASARDAANQARFERLEAALVRRPVDVDVDVDVGVRDPSPVRLATSPRGRSPKRRRVDGVDASSGTEMLLSDAEVQTDPESVLSSQGQVFSVASSLESSDSPSPPRRSSSLPAPVSPGLQALLRAGNLAHHSAATSGLDQDKLAQVVTHAVASYCQASQEASGFPSSLLPPGVRRTVSPLDSTRGQAYHIPRHEGLPTVPTVTSVSVMSRVDPSLPRTSSAPAAPVPPVALKPGRKEASQPSRGTESRRTPRRVSPRPRRSRSPRRRSPNKEPRRTKSPRRVSPIAESTRKRSPLKEKAKGTAGATSQPRARSLSPRSRRGPESRRSKSASDVESDDGSGSVHGSEDEADTRPFRQSIKLLLSSVSGLQQASDPAPLRYPRGMDARQTGRSRDKPVYLPPHATLKTWYDFAHESLSAPNVSAKKGTAFNSPSVRRTAPLYNSGKEGEFLLASREAPNNFKELSNFSQQEQVKRQLSTPLQLSSAIVKAVDKNVRVGLGAASYASHFLDGAEQSLTDLQAKVDKLSAPPESSEASHEAVDKQKKELLPILEQVSSFIERAKYASFDSLGLLAIVDVNLTLAQRDKYVTRLRPYLAHHAPMLRHASCMSKDILPNVAEVAALARDDTTQELTRQLATHLSEVTKGRRNQPQPNKGKAQSDSRGKGSQEGRQPFQARPLQTAKAADDQHQYGNSNRGKGSRKRKRSKQGAKPKQ